MGQKSRAKRNATTKKVVSPKRVAPMPSLGTSAQPSLVKSSATFQPKTIQFEEALSVPRSDIRKIGLLGVIMVLLLAALTVFSATSPFLEQVGTHLARAARL